MLNHEIYSQQQIEKKKKMDGWPLCFERLIYTTQMNCTLATAAGMRRVDSSVNQ